MLILTNRDGKKIRVYVASLVTYEEWATTEGTFTLINLSTGSVVVKETVEQLDNALRSSYFEIKEVL